MSRVEFYCYCAVFADVQKICDPSEAKSLMPDQLAEGKMISRSLLREVFVVLIVVLIVEIIVCVAGLLEIAAELE